MLQKPVDQDIPEFQKKYIAHLPEDILPYLSEQKESFVKFMEQIKPSKLDFRYAQGKWSVREVLIHIIDTEVIFNYRALCGARGDKGPLSSFDHENYIDKGNMNHMHIEYLVNYFNVARYNSLLTFAAVLEDKWDFKMTISDYTMKLKGIPYMIGGHLDHHKKILEERYL